MYVCIMQALYNRQCVNYTAPPWFTCTITVYTCVPLVTSRDWYVSFLEGPTSVTDVQSHHTTVCSLGKYVATDNLKRVKRVVDSEI